MHKYLLIIFFVFAYAESFSQSVLTGKVESQTRKEKLAGAFVSCSNNQGKRVNTVTDIDGAFKVKDLPPGSYELKIEYVGFITYTDRVVIEQNKTTELKILLAQDGKSLADVQVFGKISQEEDAGARQKEQRSNNVVNVISAKAMERSPDINAANVLQRMSGLTIQRNGGGDEAYAIIRGLDPRYSNTLINGIKIASPDEKSRFVPLSIIPSDLLGSIEVHKSLTPEMEADAIGGTVNMVMKDAPDKKVFKILGSVGYSKLFWDRKYEDFSKSDIGQRSLIEQYGPSYTAKPGEFSRSNLDFKPITPLPNTVFSATLGQRFLNNKLGVLLAETFQNQYYGSNSVFNQASVNIHTSQPTYSDYAVRAFSTQQLNNGLVLHLDYSFNDKHKITFTNVVLYSYLAQSRTIVDTAIIGGNGGRTVPGTGPVSTDYLSITSRQVIENAKLEGKHILSKHFLFDWTGVFSYATKRSPDFADIAVNKKIDTVHTTNDIHGPYTFVTTPDYFDNINRIWQHNEDKDFDGIANLTYKTVLPKNIFLEIKGGGLYRHKTRYNIQDEYQLLPTTSSSGVKQIYTNIYDAEWTVYNSHGTYDYDKNNYRLFEDVTAAFGQFKLVFPRLDIVGGVRQEHTSQGYTLNTFYPTQINGITKTYTDMLPSGAVKIKLNSKTNIRASYFKSLARPNYYDLVPANIRSVSSATVTTGNPQLRHSVADNYDLRYEFFPREEEQLFAGIFYKKIQDPIESAYVNGTTFQPQNFGTAKVYGLELQFSRYFGKFFGVTGNYTYLHSEIYSTKSYIDLSQNIAKDSLQKRSLQGQADHTLNLSLLYRNEKRSLFVQVAYEYIGKTLALVYPLYNYDYYQAPQSFLSLSAEKQLRNRHFTLFGKFNNILNTHTKQEINNLLVVDEVTKFNFSLGIRYAN
ncbi:MAG TPA: outer membrane beta-barrel protein [Puia sp.]|nr:outer membrane beta-barrel protein [Puia sp.]